MVSPSATPITLPDQAQVGQGSRSSTITARYRKEVIRLDMIRFPKRRISCPRKTDVRCGMWDLAWSLDEKPIQQSKISHLTSHISHLIAS